MMKKLMLVAGLALVLAFGLIAGRGTPTKAFVAPGIQDFSVDLVNCLVPVNPDAVSPNTQGPIPMSCLAGEAKGVDPGPNQSVSFSTAINLPAGDRLGYPYVYNGPGWGLKGDTLGDHTLQVGDVASSIDLYDDGTVDIVGDSTNCTVGGVPTNCDGLAGGRPR